MTNHTELPHQTLDSYKVAREICMRVYAAKISNAQLRDQAESGLLQPRPKPAADPIPAR